MRRPWEVKIDLKCIITHKQFFIIMIKVSIVDCTILTVSSSKYMEPFGRFFRFRTDNVVQWFEYLMQLYSTSITETASNNNYNVYIVIFWVYFGCNRTRYIVITLPSIIRAINIFHIFTRLRPYITSHFYFEDIRPGLLYTEYDYRTKYMQRLILYTNTNSFLEA